MSPRPGGQGEGDSEADALQQKVFALENQIAQMKVEHKRALLEAVQNKKGSKELGDDVLQDLIVKDERVDRLTYQIISFLYFGTKITYVGSKGETTRKCLFLSSESGQMYVCLGNLDHDDKPLKTTIYEKIPVREIKRVVLGQYSDAFRRMNAHANVANPMHHPFFDNSIEIIGKKKKSVDLWAETPSDFEAWVMALNQVTGIPAEWGDTMDLTPYPHVQILDAEEMAFCSTNHIVPVDYILAKEKILSQDCNFLTLFDVRTVSCLDLYHSQKLFAFLVHRGWVSHRKLFFLDRAAIEKNVRFGLLDSGAPAQSAEVGGDDMEF
jgi:DNA polymerase III psi subunit